jgi:DNA repair protein RecO (recombination protein O)
VSVVTTPAILLRAFNYSETSQVLRFHTPDHGVVSVMAKGVRRSSGKGRGGLETFGMGRLTFYNKATRELQTLSEFAPERAHRGLASNVMRFAGASMLAELVLEHAGSDSNPGLFQQVLSGLAALESVQEGDLFAAVLMEAWGIVGALGYSPQVEPCVRCDRPLEEAEIGRFDFGAGGVRCPDCADEIDGPRVGPVARSHLLGLLRGRIPDDLRKPRAQLRLLSDFVTYHVSDGKPLQSFTFLVGLEG